MKNRRSVFLILTILLLVCITALFLPKNRVRLFVGLYHSQVEESLAAGHGVPADDAVLFGYKAVNSWNSNHPMTEYILSALGDTYYGCYYSPDDVPLAFQNTDVSLTERSAGQWTWNAGGDNHGITIRLLDRWYYFEASF